MTTRPRPTLEPLLAALACIVVGWLVWDPLATRTWFFADDWTYLQSFVAIDYALQLGELVPWATFRHRALDRTIKTILFSHFGFAASADHRIQLGIHILTSILLFVLVRSLVRARAAAWIAAAVFLLNRFTIHTVSWFSLLHDNLTACFSAIVLLCWVRSWRADARGWAWYAGAVLAFMLGLKAKEALVVLPVLVVLLSVLFRPSSAPAWPVEAAKVGVLFAIAVVFYLSAPRYLTPLPTDPYFQSFTPAVIARSYWWYLGQIAFVPAAVVTRLQQLPAVVAVAGIATIIGVPLMALAIAAPGARLLVFGWAMLWLGLLPTAVLPNHYDYAYYAYTPMVGAALASGGAVALVDGLRLPHRTRLVALAAAWGLVVLAYGKMRGLPERFWYVAVANESQRVMASLNETLPTVPHGTHLVLVGVAETSPFRWVTWYDQGPTNVVQSWYRDPTLAVTLVKDEAGARGADDAGTIVLVWTGNAFARAAANVGTSANVR